jgi:hypothetical protein
MCQCADAITNAAISDGFSNGYDLACDFESGYGGGVGRGRVESKALQQVCPINARMMHINEDFIFSRRGEGIRHHDCSVRGREFYKVSLHREDLVLLQSERTVTCD